MTADNERILKDLTGNLQIITSRLDEIIKSDTVPPELQSGIEELRAHVIFTFSQLSYLRNVSAKLRTFLKTSRLGNDPSCRRWR